MSNAEKPRIKQYKRRPIRLRYPRKEAMAILGISQSTIIRREQAGLLTPIRDVPGGGVYYSHADIMKMAKG